MGVVDVRVRVQGEVVVALGLCAARDASVATGLLAEAVRRGDGGDAVVADGEVLGFGLEKKEVKIVKKKQCKIILE